MEDAPAILTDHSLPPALAPQSLTVAGHELTVFVESAPLFEVMLRDIAQARRRVWLETYIFFNDEGGRRFAEALKAKAREGVDVRVLYDAFGSVTTPESFFTDMRAAGVKFHAYHTIFEGLRRFRFFTVLNRRNHRKLLVVDDIAGYFGGMNIIDNVEDVPQIKAQKRPRSSGWRDVHVRLAGPQQSQLADSFERMWARVHGRRFRRVPRHVRRAQLRNLAELTKASESESIHFFDSAPGRLTRAARVYAWLIRRAQKQITLSMAYFIPVGAVLRALLAARRRRVGIRVIVPGMSDVPLVQYATSHLYGRLLRRGFRVYERHHRMLHAKVMIIDDLYTLVGSANLDPRSLYSNLEFVAVIRSQALAQVMHGIWRFERRHSQRITLAACRRVTAWRRLLNRLAWMLRWGL